MWAPAIWLDLIFYDLAGWARYCYALDGFRQDVSALVDVSFRTQRYAISELDITKRCKEAYLVAIGHIS